MARKLIVFLTGAVLLSAAWIGVVSSIESRQESLNAEGAPIKLDLMESRWQRLAGFKAVAGEKLKKPAKFQYRFSGLDMVLVDSIKSKELSSDLYLDVKTAVLDAGKKSSFYTFEAPSGERYLLRASRSNGDLEVTGFDLDSTLNFFGQGLEDTDWFVLDSKKRVLAAGERAYVGKAKAAGSDYESFKYTLSGKTYEFLALKEKGANLFMANFMGVLGILLVLTGLFFYTGDEVFNSLALANKKDFSYSKIEGERVFGPLKGEELSATAMFERSTINEEIDDDIPDDVRMVDLSNTKEPLEESLDYTGFLIENPILAKAPAESEQTHALDIKNSEIKTPEIKIQAPAEVKVEAVTSDDWVKLAEELSANIDKFTEEAKQSKSGKAKADA